MNNKLGAPRWSVLFKLSLLDSWHDRKVSICLIASVIAVVAPLLLLFGLKFGIVSQMHQELLSDPRNKEIRMIASDNLDEQWFNRMRALQPVGFVMPLTRSLNSVADLFVNSSHFVENAELIPTAPNDPLLGSLEPPRDDAAVILSFQAAQRLGVQAGAQVRLNLTRQRDRISERAQLVVTVQEVLPASAFGRPAALVTLALLVAIEDYRDGFNVPFLKVEQGSAPPPRQFYARARIYAKDISMVEPLVELLTTQRLETTSRLAEIKTVQSIDRVLSVVFTVIAWAAVVGCAAALIGGLMANIERKRKDLALLRLFGYGRAAMRFYVVVQATTLTLCGFLLGCLFYGAGSLLFNQLLGANLATDRFACRLDPIHFAIALGCTLLLSSCASVVGGTLVTNIDPAESLRDV